MYQVFEINPTSWKREWAFTGKLAECQEAYRQIIRGGNLASITKVK